MSVVWAVLAMLAMTATDLLRPWPLKIIFDYILLDRAVPKSLGFAAETLETRQVLSIVLLSSSIVVIAVLRGLFAYVESYQTARLGNQIAFRLRNELFSHLQRLSLAFHSRSRTGELMTRISGDTGQVKRFFSDSVLVLGTHCLTIVGAFVVMFLMNWKLGLIVLASFPILVSNVFILHRRATVAARRQRDKEDGIANRINEALSSVQLTQAFGRERFEQERFESENGQYLDQSLRNARIESAAARAVEITTAIGTSAVILYGSLQVINGAMSPGTILVFSSYLHGLYRPIRRMVKLTIRFSRVQVSVQRISEILSQDQDIKDGPCVASASGVRGAIAFDHVSFAYSPSDGDVLRDLTLCIQPGQHVAIVGASGAGKSTLVGLILRLYDPRCGRITMDGIDLKDYQLESLRGQIGIVLQDSVLRGATVYENIAYGNLDASRRDVIAAAEAARVHEFVSELKHGYDSVVGERGARLSGGQQRRIAIARALIRNSPILIMDEPMAGLDTDSERKVSQAIRELTNDKTCLTITHNLDSAATADVVVVLDQGTVIECGTPDELLATASVYKKMHDRRARVCAELPLSPRELRI